MKRWRTALWALLILLPGGLWILGAVALVNALRRQHARWAQRAEALPAPAAEESVPFAGCVQPPAGDAASSTTWF